VVFLKYLLLRWQSVKPDKRATGISRAGAERFRLFRHRYSSVHFPASRLDKGRIMLSGIVREFESAAIMISAAVV